jgi:S1-C subfamily serine protease
LFIAGIAVGVVTVLLFVLVPLTANSRNTAAPLPSFAPASQPRVSAPALPSADDLDQPPLAKPRSPDSADLIEFLEPSVVRIDTLSANGREGGIGSGFFIHEAGIVATNFHVIKNARRGEVTLANGKTFPIARFLARSERQDLALLAVDLQGNQISPVRLATANPRKGEDVLAMGTPIGLDFSASKGIVSAIRSESECRSLGLPIQAQLIQTTTPISPGNSGGPLINMLGEVVGVNTLGSNSEKAQNLNFAVSVLELRELFRKSARPEDRTEGLPLPLPSR